MNFTWSDSIRTFHCVVTVVEIFLTAFGLLTNIAVVYVFCRTPSLWLATNIYISNLTAANIGFLLSILMNVIASLVSGKLLFWDVNLVVCIVRNFLAFSAIYVTFLTTGLICLERFLAICRPFKKLGPSNKRRARRCSLATWVVGTAFSVTHIIQCSYPGTIGLYIAAWTQVCFIGFAVLPTVITLYILVMCYLRRHAQTMQSLVRTTTKASMVIMGPEAQKQGTEVDKATQMLLITTGLLFICGVPRLVHGLIVILDALDVWAYDLTKMYMVESITNILLVVHATLNPVAYSYINTPFRNATMRLFSIAKQIQPCHQPPDATVTRQLATDKLAKNNSSSGGEKPTKMANVDEEKTDIIVELGKEVIWERHDSGFHSDLYRCRCLLCDSRACEQV